MFLVHASSVVWFSLYFFKNVSRVQTEKEKSNCAIPMDFMEFMQMIKRC